LDKLGQQIVSNQSSPINWIRNIMAPIHQSPTAAIAITNYQSLVDDAAEKQPAGSTPPVPPPAACSSWSIAQVGRVNELSRDGSPHATDETVNTATHLAALLFSILGSALLIAQSSAMGEPWKIVSFAIYGTTLIFLFACSTLHHGIAGDQYEDMFRRFDYLAIYPLIAGTFTPLCLVYYHDQTVGWVFSMTVWGLCILCMIATGTCFHKIPKWLSMTLYICLGWIGALFTGYLIPVLGIEGFALFLLGGVIYTAGGVVFTTERPNPVPGFFGFHEIWHIAVILAAACHWLVMYLYVLPSAPV
jgi:hemolysin III